MLINADANESDLLLNQRMGYVAVSRAREDAIIFTNSTDQLKGGLNRNVNKEMAVEALRQSRDRSALSQGGWEHLVSPTDKEVTTPPSFDHESISNSIEDRTRDSGKEIDLDLGS